MIFSASLTGTTNSQRLGGGYEGSSTILTSQDGVNWTNRYSETDVWLDGIAYGNNQFVATSRAPELHPCTSVTSSDGITWISHIPGGPGPWVQGITYANSRFVAVGDVGMIATSPDGITWTNRDSGTMSSLRGIAYGNNTFLAVGSEGAILQSAAVAPMQPALGQVLLLPSGAVQVTVTGLAGETYPIQASTNLTDWLTITNVALTNTSGQFEDSSAMNFPQRFYRAVVQ